MLNGYGYFYVLLYFVVLFVMIVCNIYVMFILFYVRYLKKRVESVEGEFEY